jgi:hypothetical protein
LQFETVELIASEKHDGFGKEQCLAFDGELAVSGKAAAHDLILF